MRIHPSIVFLLGGALAGSAYAQVQTQAQQTKSAQAKTEVVQFADGATSASVKSEIDGYATKTYTLNARAGQSARVAFKPNNGDCEFIMYRPGQTPGVNEAFFNGSNMGNEFTGILPATGAYTIWVGLSREAARGLQTCHFTIVFSLTGGAS